MILWFIILNPLMVFVTALENATGMPVIFAILLSVIFLSWINVQLIKYIGNIADSGW